jgi:pimeloyl-ACP methyl ester carboxylesterase/UDP:flavonoid glycosyltransferase YjiC (YdhE family)
MIDVDGVAIGYESFGDGDAVVLLMPTWCIVDSRVWKHQVPYLSRHYRVVTWDGPGNGRSSRPTDAAFYTADFHVRGALAVLDHLGIDRVIAVASSGGTHRTLLLAADHPDRVAGVAFVGPLSALVDRPGGAVTEAFLSGDQERFVEVFMRHAFTEPHSSKALEDGIGWGRGTTMEVLAISRMADAPADLDAYRQMCASIEQPVLVVQGTEDGLTPEPHGRSIAEAIGNNAQLLVVEGGGHRIDLRDPVVFSRALREFVDRVTDRRPREAPRWTRATARPRRAMFLSSPIGLGHARRDLAIARELRALHPDIEIEWLAQDPVTRVLGDAGESIHPASGHLVSESAHFVSETAGHELHCFQAWRRMDEIIVANFMVLHDLLETEHYDLLIADEAWEVDHFLHENPELKCSPLAWLTDFVGWLPTDNSPASEEALTTDYNAEMLEHIARYPWVRDLSIFVGGSGDVVPHAFGPGLPSIRDWTSDHFEFPGYITGFEPIDRDEARAQLGYAPDERVCIATVGGSGVGATLLRAVVDTFPQVRAKLPDLRLHLVTGPRIDPAVIGGLPDGCHASAYVPDLYRHLAACDLALVQGGLTTAMELTANQRPFLYFPLIGHFEQQIHVPHRLDRYRAGRRCDLAEMDADALATAIVQELDRPIDYLPVESDGAARAARLIADLL